MAYRSVGLTPAFGLRREIDRLFEDAFSGSSGSGASAWRPAVDIQESAKELRVNVELPGLKSDQIELNVENGVLTIRGEKSEERKEEAEESRYHLVERTYGMFYRSFQLPAGVDEEQIEADFNNGVLAVRIPKTAIPQPRKIAIGGSIKREVGSGESQSGGRASSRVESGRSEQRRDRVAAKGAQE